MVTQYGMTESLGAIKLGDSTSEPFLGRDMGHQRNYSEDVAAKIDEETKKFLAVAHQEAFEILEENRDVLDTLVLELFDKETLDKEQVARIFEPLRRRPERPAWTGSDRRVPSAIPPVEIPQWIKDRATANAAAFAASNGDGPKVRGRRGGSRRDPDAARLRRRRARRSRRPGLRRPSCRRTDR